MRVSFARWLRATSEHYLMVAAQQKMAARYQGYGLAPPQPLPLAPLDYHPAPFVDLVVSEGQRAGGRSLPVRLPSTERNRRIKKTATSPIRMMS